MRKPPPPPPKGNQYAKGCTTSGRPPRTDEEIKQLCDKLIDWAKKNDSLTFESFASNIMEVDRTTLNSWCEAYPEFSKCFKRAKNMLAARWLENGLNGRYNAYIINQHYYRLSDEHKSWMREMKNKEKEDQIINVNIPSYDKKNLS